MSQRDAILHSPDEERVDKNVVISVNALQASRVRSPNTSATNLEEETIHVEDDTDDDDDKQTSPLLKAVQNKIEEFGKNPLFYQSSQTTFNEAIRFQISGLIGSVLFFILYELLLYFVAEYEYGPVTAWLFSYMASIWWQFELHRFIVFGKDRIRDYWAALRTTFAVYSLSLIISTAINFVLTKLLVVHYRVAWVITTVLIGIINYFLLRSTLKV